MSVRLVERTIYLLNKYIVSQQARFVKQNGLLKRPFCNNLNILKLDTGGQMHGIRRKNI